MRSSRRVRVTVGAAVLVLVALAAIDSVARRRSLRFDLTAEQHLSLTDETHEVVDAVRRPVRIVAVLRRSQPGRPEAASLLARYRDRNRRISFSLVDPDESPGAVRRLGVDPVFGGVAVESGDRVERGPTVTEQDVTAALARIVRDRTPTVCVTAGHGEADPASTLDVGLSRAADLLRSNGYRLRTVDLLVSDRLPSCDVLLVANPTAPLGDATDVLVRYLDGGGRALVVADPSTVPVDLAPIVEPYGLAFDRGLVLEGDAERRLPDDPFTPVLSNFAGAHPVTRRLPPLVLPGVMGVVADAKGRSGLAATWLVRTSPLAYLERDPATPSFDRAEDRVGPVDVAAAADLSSNTGTSVRRTRVVIVGDADFLTNGLIRQAGNGRLLVRSLDWLTLDDDLVSVSANLPAVRPLAFTPGRVRYALFLTAGVVPALFLLAGAMVWALRRGR